MKNLTIEHLKSVVERPILIAFYNAANNNTKHIQFHPIDQKYKILKNYEEINWSYEAETAIKYYNEITF